mgnify:CR=1 FL=1
MSKKKINRYSIKDMLNEKKAVGYFPGMYLVYDIPDQGPDGEALNAEEELAAKNSNFGSLKQRIADKIEDITKGKIYSQEDEENIEFLKDMKLPLDHPEFSIYQQGLGSVILGDEDERLLADLGDNATQEEKNKRAAQREDVEEVLGKSAGRLKQLQRIFISLLGEQDGNETFGILLHVIGHPGGPAVESKSTVNGKVQSSPAPEGEMKKGFLAKGGFPNIFFSAFKNVTAEDLQKIGGLSSFEDLEGESPTSEFWTAMYNLAGGPQPAVGIGEIYAALRCNGVQGDDSGSGDEASVDVISHVNGQALNNKKMDGGAQGATTKAAFCAEVKKLIDDDNISKGWPDFKLLVESFGLHNDSAPSSLTPDDVMTRMAEIRMAPNLEAAKKIIKSDDYAGTFNNPKAAIVAQEGMAYIFHEATTREINAKSTKGQGSGKTPFTSWQFGNKFAEIREATPGKVCLPVSRIGSGRIKYDRGGYFKLLPNEETTSTAWLGKVDIEEFGKAAENPSEIQYDSESFPEIDVPQLGASKPRIANSKVIKELLDEGFVINGVTYKLQRNDAELETWSQTCYGASSMKALGKEYATNPFIGYVVRKNNTELTESEKVELYNKLPPERKPTKGIPVGQDTIRKITITMPYKIAKGRKALMILGANAQFGGPIDDEQIIKFLNSIKERTIDGGVYSAWLKTPGLKTTEVPSYTEKTNEAVAAGKIYKKSLLEIWDLLP